MNYELHLISKILKSANSDLEFKKVREQEYGGEIFLLYKKHYNYIVDFYNNYGKVPDEKTFLENNRDVSGLLITPEPSNFYIEQIRSQFLFKLLTELNSSVVDKLRNSTPFDAMRHIQTEVEKLQKRVHVYKDGDLAKDKSNRIAIYKSRIGQGIITGVPCGWSKIDLETMGWQKKELTLLAGRPYSFKSWILLVWAINAWHEGFEVLFFSKEMGSMQLMRRIDSWETKVRFKDLKTGTLSSQEFLDMEKKMNDLYDDPSKPMFKIIDNYAGYNYEYSCVRDKIRQYRPDIVFIDGVYLFNGIGNSDWEKQTDISRRIKSITLEEDIPIVCSMQLNSSGKKAAYSDSWTQDPDNIIKLRRMWDSIAEDWTNTVLLKGEKFRDAENMKFFMDVDLDCMDMTENMIYTMNGFDEIKEEEEGV